MSILDEYRKAIVNGGDSNMDFPHNSNLSENDKEEYEKALTKMRNGVFSEEEVNEAINNSHRNMKILGEEHNSSGNEDLLKMSSRIIRLTDDEMSTNGLLRGCGITEISVIRAYCPKCGKELVAQTPPMYNPFTMEKVCLHECCGEKYNCDKTYPHIMFVGDDGEEIKAFI